jgi:hypothetical protein
MTRADDDRSAPRPGAAHDLEPGRTQHALQQALARLLSSVARLAVARGLPYAAAEAMLKQAFVDAAAAAHPALAPHRRVSRISAATGINRREVTRLTQPARRATPAAPGRSRASELFAHWRTQPPYRDEQGEPKRLPRQGPAPSFETLAQEITRDVHPRSLLEELTRLGLAELDPASDTVTLLRDAFVPRGDSARMLGFLGENVGDHLAAAVDNVLAERQTPHFEQAVFADGLAPESLATLRPLIAAQWQALLAALVPHLEARVAADAAQPAAARERVRVGLYSYHESAPTGPTPTADKGEDT